MATKTTKATKPAKKPGRNGAPATVSAFDVLTLAETAAYLRLPEDAVRAEAEAGRLVGLNVRGEWRFVRAGIVVWLQTPRVAVTKPQPSVTPFQETPQEYEAFMASIRAYRDEVNRATGHGKYAEE